MMGGTSWRQDPQQPSQHPLPSSRNALGERLFMDWSLPPGVTIRSALRDVDRVAKQRALPAAQVLTCYCSEQVLDLAGAWTAWAAGHGVRGDIWSRYYSDLGIKDEPKARRLWGNAEEIGMRPAHLFAAVIGWTEKIGDADDATLIMSTYVLTRRCAMTQTPLEIELSAMAQADQMETGRLWILVELAFSLSEDAILDRLRDHATGTAQPIADLLVQIEERSAAARIEPARYAETVLNEAREQQRKAAALAAFAASGATQRVEAQALTAADLELALADLQALTGLSEAKSAIQRFLAVQQVQQARGIGERPALNLVFTGSPGTGKTTVARLVGRILGGAGLLADGHLVEIDKSGLVAAYVGQTGPKVQAAFDEARGGVLFIDEAYGLLDETGGGFGREAVDTMLKLVEDRRGDLCVILAGYQAEMQKLLQSNPGMGSRFSTAVHFADYTPSELMEITRQSVAKQGLALAPGCEALLQAFFSRRPPGNGRLVRNLIEQTSQEQALRVQPRLAELSKGDLNTIQPSDLQAALSRLG